MKITSASDAAFPRPCGAANGEEQSLEQDGVTCLEWYAAKAMEALISHGDHEGQGWETLASSAFDAAEAMCNEAKRRRDEMVAKWKRENPDEE